MRSGRRALGLYFVVLVPKPKTVKNRVHLDLCGEDAAEVRSVLSDPPCWTTADSAQRGLRAPQGRAREWVAQACAASASSTLCAFQGPESQLLRQKSHLG